MIGKQTKGTSFGGCVRYVLKEEKSKLLEAVGSDIDTLTNRYIKQDSIKI